MKKWLKRVRGVVGTGLIWAAGWSPIGAVVGLVVGVVVGEVGLGVVAFYVWNFAALGFGNGAVFMFSTRFKLKAESRKEYGPNEKVRRFDEMSFSRVVGIGGMLAGSSFSALFLGTGDPLSEFLLSIGDPPTLRWLVIGLGALLGAGSAAGSLALARRAHDRELLEYGRGRRGLRARTTAAAQRLRSPRQPRKI